MWALCDVTTACSPACKLEGEHVLSLVVVCWKEHMFRLWLISQTAVANGGSMRVLSACATNVMYSALVPPLDKCLRVWLAIRTVHLPAAAGDFVLHHRQDLWLGKKYPTVFAPNEHLKVCNTIR